jgi:hypothetical protein
VSLLDQEAVVSITLSFSLFPRSITFLFLCLEKDIPLFDNMIPALSLLAALGSLSHAAALPTIPQLEIRQSPASINATLGNVTIFATGMSMILSW